MGHRVSSLSPHESNSGYEPAVCVAGGSVPGEDIPCLWALRQTQSRTHLSSSAFIHQHDAGDNLTRSRPSDANGRRTDSLGEKTAAFLESRLRWRSTCETAVYEWNKTDDRLAPCVGNEEKSIFQATKFSRQARWKASRVVKYGSALKHSTLRSDLGTRCFKGAKLVESLGVKLVATTFVIKLDQEAGSQRCLWRGAADAVTADDAALSLVNWAVYTLDEIRANAAAEVTGRKRGEAAKQS